jgi:capping protein beta
MSDIDKQLHCALDLFRRLPPAQLETNLSFVTELAPDLTDDLLQTVDCPLKTAVDPTNQREYLLCDYNRDGDSYRSPYTNKYYPDLPDGIVPPANLRKIEETANAIFSSYCEAYYEGGISSAYVWEVEGGFAIAVLFKKDGSGLRGVSKGVWDSIHVVEVVEKNDKVAQYSLTTTIILSMATDSGNQLDLSGSVQRQETTEATFDKNNTHIVNIGNAIQKMENYLRDQLQTVYFDKAREITRTLRSTQSSKQRTQQSAMANELANALANRRR